jgi:EAL domain-containing protein (putative c-di-GMP-specific phosphodiesterase class I)
VDNIKLACDLNGAVERGEILAYYQPQVAVATGRIVAAEALCRWRHPEFGLIAPATFIPLAEETGLIHEIGGYMMTDGCRTAADWQERGIAIGVAVNVTAPQLATSRFFEDLNTKLVELSLDPRQLTIEITESSVITDVPGVAAKLAALRGRGVGISIDDFGTGYSSIAQLLSLPATELKIDQSLIRDDATSNGALMAAVVGLVHERGLSVVAEGIETATQLERVRELGCDRVQGYLIGRPMPSSEFEKVFISRDQADR